MDLTTRCPQCGAEFPVSLQQLQLRKGYIRCINCAHIFDGYEAVVPAAGTEHTVPTTAPAAPAPKTEPRFSPSGIPAAPAAGEPRFIVSGPGQSGAGIPIRTREAASAEPAAFTVRDHDHRPDDGGRHTIGDPAPDEHDAYRDTGSGLYVEPRHGHEAGPEFVHDDEQPGGIGLGGVFWSLLVVLGLAAAVLQAAYIYRVQIASELPSLRPALERYCETLGCTVEYPRRIAQIVIMDSSLQAIRDGNETPNGNRLMLNVVLRNNYDRPQQWPTLSVELVDFSGTVAARRLLAPSDYLPEISLQRPFPARSEVRVSVPITVQGAQINGYQLDKFFP